MQTKPTDPPAVTASGWCCRHQSCGGISVPTATIGGAERCKPCTLAAGESWPELDFGVLAMYPTRTEG